MLRTGSGVRTKSGKNWMLGKIFVWLLATVLLATVCSAQAQQPKKVSRIGYLSTQEPARESGRFEGIRLALREIGYIEGRNIAIEYRHAGGKLDRLPELTAELVRLKVDFIVAETNVGG
jgi:putative ABC transport system substrate-binding protein